LLILRILAGWALIVAVMALVDDAMQWTAGAVGLTSLASHAAQLMPDGLAAAEGLITQRLHPWLWSPIMTTLLATPTVLAFAVLSALLYAAARPRETVDIYAN
jgi:hypothetical protein